LKHGIDDMSRDTGVFDMQGYSASYSRFWARILIWATRRCH
jgi:hypothetical protein